MTQTIARPVSGRGRVAALVVLGLTVAQLLVGALAPGLQQFTGKAFGARLLAYPAMMLLVPAAYAVTRRRRGGTEPLPWDAFALIMAPFLIDVTGNTLDLYDSLRWWDDANHFGNWLLLTLGGGLLLRHALPDLARWAVVLLVTGLGSILTIRPVTAGSTVIGSAPRPGNSTTTSRTAAGTCGCADPPGSAAPPSACPGADHAAAGSGTGTPLGTTSTAPGRAAAPQRVRDDELRGGRRTGPGWPAGPSGSQPGARP
jgi:hypothetical protein